MNLKQYFGFNKDLIGICDKIFIALNSIDLEYFFSKCEENLKFEKGDFFLIEFNFKNISLTCLVFSPEEFVEIGHKSEFNKMFFSKSLNKLKKILFENKN